ncbi:MAG: hydroxyacylglutathione hydrolase [Gammaproteobacteria bacterium]
MKIIPIKAFRDNYIWLIRDLETVSNKNQSSSPTIIIDPGDGLPVIRYLEENQCNPLAIFITHHHYDHIDGIKDLLDYKHIPVYGPATESIPFMTHPLGDGDDIMISDSVTFRVLKVPGHTQGHIAYLASGTLFCGDTLFACGCGRLFDGTAEQLYHSLNRFAALPSNTKVYCTHEYTLSNIKFALEIDPENPELQQRKLETEKLRKAGCPSLPTTIGLEKSTNPFMRCNVQTIKIAVERHFNAHYRTEMEIFTALRKWKDTY